MFKMTIELPTPVLTVDIWGGQTMDIDLRKIHPVGANKMLSYGAGRLARDGNHPDEFGEYQEVISASGRKSRIGKKGTERSETDRKEIAILGAKSVRQALYDGTVRETAKGRALSPDVKWGRDFVFSVTDANRIKRKDIPAMPNLSSVENVCKRLGIDPKLLHGYIDKQKKTSSDIGSIKIDLSSLS